MKFITCLRSALIIGLLSMTISCTDSQIENYAEQAPAFEMEAYFSGPVKAWGIVQNWRGRVVKRFDIELNGSWKDGVGTLVEDFNYYDGTTQQRVWTINKVDTDRYQGTASDILDKAEGEISASAVRWNYVMDLPVKDTTYKIRFDDRMWQMNDGVLINRSYLKKFGITVAEVTILMQKQ